MTNIKSVKPKRNPAARILSILLLLTFILPILTFLKPLKPKNPELSVIIPVYNVEQYLSECLDSVINQSYKNFEIICINNGSTDNSLEILMEYQKKDSRIKLINQKNNSVSSARNQGMKKSKGKYITFVDSDDYLDLDTYSSCMKKIYETDCDILAFDWIYFSDDENVQEKIKEMNNRKLKDKIIEDGRQYIDSTFESVYNGEISSRINKIFKRETFSRISFNEKVFFGEDDLFVLTAVPRAKKIVLFAHKFCFCRQRLESLSDAKVYKHKKIDKTKLERMAISAIERTKSHIDDWHSLGYNKNIWLLDKAVSIGLTYFEPLDSELRSKYSKLLLDVLDEKLLSKINKPEIPKILLKCFNKIKKFSNESKLTP